MIEFLCYENRKLWNNKCESNLTCAKSLDSKGLSSKGAVARVQYETRNIKVAQPVTTKNVTRAVR